MSSAARDRLARARVREYLAQRGPIEDASGRATALLKDAVGYKGSAVAFIQLVTAMDKAAEIKRDIRGKRTYKIAAVNAAGGAARGGVASLGRPRAGVADSAVSSLGIDYDELARAVLREMSRVYGDLSAGSEESFDSVRSERDRLIAERDEYARRLQVARRQLSALISSSLPEADGLGAETIDRVEQAS